MFAVPFLSKLTTDYHQNLIKVLAFASDIQIEYLPQIIFQLLRTGLTPMARRGGYCLCRWLWAEVGMHHTDLSRLEAWGRNSWRRTDWMMVGLLMIRTRMICLTARG
jgi:hypothetical protein